MRYYFHSLHTDTWLPHGFYVALSARGSAGYNPWFHLAVDDSEGYGAEQKFFKTLGSGLGWSSGGVLTDCGMAIDHIPSVTCSRIHF
jgi:hypothetical protein